MITLHPALARGVDAALEATVVLSFSRIGYAVRSRVAGWEDPARLDGSARRVLVTGANAGLGYATTRALLRSGARVLLSVRTESKGRDAVARLSDELGRDLTGAAEFDVLDLTRLESVRAFAQRRLTEDEPLDTIVHNAGALFNRCEETVDGLERTYQLHVVAPFLLTALLLPMLAARRTGRVIGVTSGGMYAEKLVVAQVDSPRTYRGSVAYARTKRAQVVLNREWSRRAGDRVDFQIVHPGWALTPGIAASLPVFRRVAGPILRHPDQGVDTTVFLALGGHGASDGRLWHDRRPRGEHRVPWTVPDCDAPDELWARVCLDAGIEPEPARMRQPQ